MFGFLKRSKTQYRIRLPELNLLKRYKGKCLIKTYNKDIFIWLNEKEIETDGEYIEFSINPCQEYYMSSMYLILNNKYKKRQCSQIKGLTIKKLFDIETATRPAGDA